MVLTILTGMSFHCRSVESDQKSPDAKGQPVSRVHVDYTVKSGPERLQAVLPNEAERLMKTPFAVIQACCSCTTEPVMLPCNMLRSSVLHASCVTPCLRTYHSLPANLIQAYGHVAKVCLIRRILELMAVSVSRPVVQPEM